MKKIYRHVDEVTVTKTTQKKTTTQAVEVGMQPQELDAIGRLVITEAQGGIFTPSTDHDIIGFKRKMNVVVRDNGRMVLVPTHRKPSQAKELVKTPHGKASQMECGDVLVTFRFSRSLVGRIAPMLCDETARLLEEIENWEN